ncbi:hypothetical protein [Herbaspirillum robiniae]|uniref:hypothetical protein n=1 Tax=Herbaspirillum robiniae TaxID=2014887 RepID=UPI003D76BCF2
MNIADKKAGKRALKTVSVQQLETAISAALYKITAEKYQVDIRRFDLGIDSESAHHDGAVIEMSVINVPGGCPGAEGHKLKVECGAEPLPQALQAPGEKAA